MDAARMETEPTNIPPLPDALEAWLKDQPVRCSKSFNEALRSQLHAPLGDLDATIDACLRIDPRLYNATLYQKIRATIEKSRPRPSETLWVHILRPLAAAAVLSLTFWSFQQESGRSVSRDAALPTEKLSADLAESTDLHLIFALASSFDAGTDLASLEASPDHWAFLLD